MKSIITALVFLALTTGCAKPLPVFGDVPDFSLTRETGGMVSKKSLEGNLWIADFIYTGCAEACPMLSTKMAELQKRTSLFSTVPSLVSFSVDPETDTQERLQEYATRYGADPARWMFLTGDTQVIQKTVTEGFKLSAVKSSDDPTTIFHANKFVLVDRRGRIRGYFDTDDAGLNALTQSIRRLEGEK